MVEATALRPASEADALEAIRKAGSIAGVSAFAKLVGWERTRAQRALDRWQEAGQVTLRPTPGGRTIIEAARPPDVQPAQSRMALAQPRAHRAHPWVMVPTSYVAPVLLGMVGVALSVIGMVETAAYAFASGGLLSCALAMSADALTLAMPSTIGALWRRRSPAVARALAFWLGGAAVTVSNIAGYVAEHAEEHIAGREAGAAERTLVLERLGRLREERRSITETRPPGAIVAAINDARRSEQASLRAALALARRRDAIDTELATFEQRLVSLPTVATADASAAVLSQITGMAVSEAELRRFRLALLLALPLAGGLVLSLAFALAPGRVGATR